MLNLKEQIQKQDIEQPKGKMKKKTEKKLMEQVHILLGKRGQKSFDIAKNGILEEKIICDPVYEALRYFMVESWYDVQHPALLSLACEAVGGNPDATIHIGAAIVLLTGAADIHDDIIDQSAIKGSKPTIFGKFGQDIALLAGDALLFKGLIMLHEACESLPKKQKQDILRLTKQVFFEIGSAEAKETRLRGKFDVSAEEYLDIIGMKVAIAEATAKIGALLGGGTPEEIEVLGHYGKTLGILMTIRDEFIDIFEQNELKHRAEKECLPLPILYTFQDVRKKNQIIQLLKGGKITEKEINEILDVVMEAKETRKLKRQMVSLINEEIQRLNSIEKHKKIFRILLWSTVEDIISQADFH